MRVNTVCTLHICIYDAFYKKKGLTFRERKYNPRVKLSVKRFSVEFVAEVNETIEVPENEEKLH